MSLTSALEAALDLALRDADAVADDALISRDLKTAAEKIGPVVLGVPVKVEKVSVNVFNGSFGLKGLRVDNLPGYSSDPLVALGELRVAVNVSSLFGKDAIDLNFKMFFNLFDGETAVGGYAAIRIDGDERLFAIMFVLNISHYLFQQVFNSYQAGCTAILINDNCQMNAFAFKILQQLLKVFGFGDKVRGAHNLANRAAVFISAPLFEKIFGIQQTDNIIY